MRVRGALERKDARLVQGWLVVDAAGAEPQWIEIVSEGETIGKVAAADFREDVKAAGFGSGDCGFRFAFPPDFDPEKAAAAQVRLLGTELYLSRREAVSPVQAAAEAAKAGEGSVFILGPARSGTSVTFHAMREVFRLLGVGESHVMPIYQRMLFSFYQHVKKFAGDPGVLASRLAVDDLKAAMIAHIRRFYFDQFDGAPFVDKTPGLEALVGASFVRAVFPAATIIVTTRNGVEIVESYRRKFKASFEDACREWGQCAAQIAKLRVEMPDILFLDQNEMRMSPGSTAEKLADRLGRPDKASELADFLSLSRSDAPSDASTWDHPLTIDTAGWSEDEKRIYRSYEPAAAVA